MPFPSPRLLAVQAVLRTPDVLGHDEIREERFIKALGGAFPRVLGRQRPFEGAPSQYPHLTLGSSSSHLAISLAQAEFNVNFYGELIEQPDLALQYVETKLGAIHRAYSEVDDSLSMVGVIATVQFSVAGTDIDPVAHVLKTHLRSEIAVEDVQDAEARIALRLRDTYYATLSVKNYEVKQILRPVNPMEGPVVIRSWEGTVTDTGLQVLIDINNNLEAQHLRRSPVVTDVGISEVVRILRTVLHEAGPGFAEHGGIDVAKLAEAGA